MRVDFSKLDRAFNPKCVVVVGDKGATNYRWVRQNMELGAHLYSVQIDPKEALGIQALGVTNLMSVVEVPEPIDLAIVAVPREVTPKILADLIKKGVGAAHFFTAGYSETRTERGIHLERNLIELAEPANFHLIGPNCMGIMNPRMPSQTYAAEDQHKRQPSALANGSVGLMSQSGMNAITMGRETLLQGVKVGKLVSYGNGTVLDSTDYLEYYAQDSTITAIGMYVEGVKDSKRFFELLRDVSKRKAVVIWKGGRTEAGARTVSFHTDSSITTKAVWDENVEHSGALSVCNVEQLVDVLQALQFCPSIHGDRVGIIGGTGGQSVAMTDAFSEAGMSVPPLTESSCEKLKQFFSVIGGSYMNPIDTGNSNSSSIPRILDIMEQDENLDNLVIMLSARSWSNPGFESIIETIRQIRQYGRKPVLALVPTMLSPEDTQQAQVTIAKLQEVGVPGLFSIERGAVALKKAFDYHAKNRSLVI